MKSNYILLALIVAVFVFSIWLERRTAKYHTRARSDPVLEQDAKQISRSPVRRSPSKRPIKGSDAISRKHRRISDYSKMDEFLYMAGMSSYYLSENKGKQNVDQKSEKEMKQVRPDKLQEGRHGLPFDGRRQISAKQVCPTPKRLWPRSNLNSRSCSIT